MTKDWTLTDQADAADAGRDRNWWRRDSALGPWENEPDENQNNLKDS